MQAFFQKAVLARPWTNSPHGAQQRCVDAIAQHHSADHLFRKNRQWDLRGGFRASGRLSSLSSWRSSIPRMVSSRQRVLIMKAAIDGARSEPGVLRDAGNRGAFNPVLPQDFSRCFL